MSDQRNDGSPVPTGPIPRQWDETYQRGEWNFLNGMGEAPRNALVSGLIHRLVGQGSVLDVGCGEGPLLDFLDLSRIRYSGLDLSPTAIAAASARSRGHDVELFAISMLDFEPADGQGYDLIVFNESLYHVPGPVELFNRYTGFLKPGGFMLISHFQTYGPVSDARFFAPLLEAELASGRWKPIHVAEVANLDNGLRWKSYCFQPGSSL